MRPEESDLKYVWDMLDAARTIEGAISGKTLADYEATKTLRYIVERGIEIIGEAARNTSTDFRAAHPGIPWQPIIASRNIIAHEYADIQNDKVYRMATVHVPDLIRLLSPILEQNPPQP